MHRRGHVLLDSLSHDSLRQGAAGGATVEFFRHLDNDAVRRHPKGIRATDAKNAVLVVTEGVFSMDSDTPQLAELLGICREYGAQLMVDVAHDSALWTTRAAAGWRCTASSARSTSS